MKLRFSLAALAAAAALLATPALAGPTTVRLFAERLLQPTTTLEVRFEDNLVPIDKIGTTADSPPIVITPAVKGSFVWLSQRSGTFKPEEPYALGTTYVVTLAPGLKQLDGTAVEAEFREILTAPPMRLGGWNSPSYLNRNDAPAEPRFSLLFNADVDPKAAAAFIRFESGDHNTIPAKVEKAGAGSHPDRYFPMWRTKDHSVKTWTERFYEKAAVSGLEARGTGAGANHLWIAPAHSLPPGDWRLVVQAGLPSTEANLHLAEAEEITIGVVRPFEVQQATPSNVIGGDRHIEIALTKSLPKEVTDKNISRWVKVEPAPANLQAKVEGREISFTGGFELGKEYQVIVAPGMPSAEPFVLAREFRDTVVFDKIPARLYFEEFATHQLSTGSRQFHLLAVNVTKIRVTARVFAADAAPQALAAYRAYEDPERDRRRYNREEPYDKVDLDGIPNQMVWQHEYEVNAGEDEQKQIALDWNEILGAGKTGVVLLTAEQIGKPAKANARPGVQTLVQVTDLGMVWKESKGETFAHVFSLATGKAVEGAEVRVFNKENEITNEAITDAAGVARVSTKTDSEWLVAANGKDTHLVDFHNHSEDLSLRQLGIREGGFEEDEEGGAADTRQALLFTERPVYKPGDTVHLKGIVRDWRGDHPHVPAGAKATLRVTDARDRRILNQTLGISDVGSLSVDVKLPTSGLGTYSVELVMAEDGADAKAIGVHSFEVQEYTPNAFEIKIPTAPATVGQAEISLPITAQYYMGKSLSQAKLTWSLDASDNGFQPAGFAAFDFCDAIRDYDLNEKLDRVSHFSDQGKLDLDATGKATVESTIPLNEKAPQPRLAHLLCEITDVDEQTVSQSSDFTIHSSDFYLGIRHLRDVIHEGDPLPVDVIAVRTDGTPTPEPVEAHLRLTRVDWDTTRVETAGDASEYRNQAHFELVSQTTIKTHALVKRGNGWTVSPDEQIASVNVGKPGLYLLEAVSKDAEGREVISTTSINVYGKGETGWDYKNPFQIQLASDKDEYLSGQSAKVLVKTPIEGEALVTVEREKVLRSFVVHLAGNAPMVEVPLLETDAPNVFVSVTLLRGAADSTKKFKAPEYRVGYCKLKVARPDAKLTVYVTPDAPSHRPGDEVKVGAQVLDFAGKPVANAEITLYAVDEGVLSLMGYETPDPLTFFNQERALAVTTGLTLPTLMSEDPEDRAFGNKGYLVGGGGEDASDALRKNFVACALWSSNLRTDAEGRVDAKFTAPDSLTRYRVIAVVQTARDQFGSAESAFEVNKPVMLEPALPRFANVGDKLILRGVLHNLTDNDGEVDVHVDFDPTVSNGSAAQHVKLPARGSLAVDIPVTFAQPGQAVWKWSANFSGGGVTYRDAVQTTLNVGYPVPLLREVHLTQTKGKDTNLLAGVSPELLEGTGVVHVSLTNSRALELRESLDQVLHYPYGCVEQTTSSTLPWVSMRGFQGVFPSMKKTDEQIADAVAHGVDRLLSMQTSSGGLSYWPGESEPLFWGSAYGGFGLAMAKRAGFAVPEEAFNRLCKYLSEQLRGAGQDNFDRHYRSGGPSDRCLALFTLAVAGQAEPAYNEVMFKKREQLSTENRALLALAILESNGPKEMVAALLDPQQEIRNSDDDWFWSSSRDTAMRLMAWNKHQPESPVVGKLVTELMGRRSNGHWMTTQGNCWSLLALSDYFRTAEKPDNQMTGTLTWQGKAQAVDVNSEHALMSAEFALNKKSAAQPMQLANPGGKTVYAEVVVESRPSNIVQPQQDQGYSIRRSYTKVEDDGTLSDLKEPRVGDRVLVTLNVEVRRPANFVVVDDPLPAIFEALNPAFKSQETRAGDKIGRAWMSDYTELREDRALFFADHIFPGDYTIRYLARVRSVGTATAPSSKVEEMYHPERFGLTESTQLTSLPLK
ncbi:MAG: alpha-2-macroglobulin family protein [Chthoniobacter sp.]|uniref:alpha-2-macroglobulin family protein n=1 Tax=Chthoniobacter sp. TaxID=2510640 RepID=UPI0032AAD95F